MKVCKDVLSNRPVSNKMKKAKVAILLSAISYSAFAIAIICVISVVAAIDTEIDFELIFFAMGAIIFVSSIVGIACSSNALLKIKGEQLLEGKNLSCAKLGMTMSLVALCLCFLYVVAYFVLILLLLGKGFLAFIELLGLLAILFGS